MSSARLAQLRSRLDALREGKVRTVTFAHRAKGLFGRPDALPACEKVDALDRELDRVGILTAADAELLRELGLRRGRAAELSRGLSSRAGEALAELDDRLMQLEVATLGGRKLAGAVVQLEGSLNRLHRAVKVAEIFGRPDADPAQKFEVLRPPRRYATEGAPASARVAAAEFFAERARLQTSDLLQKRRDLDLAYELLLRVGSDSDRDRVRPLRLAVGQARERVKQVPAVRSHSDLAKHLRHSGRRKPEVAYQSLRALYERAIEADDHALAELSHRALKPFLPSAPELREALEREGPAKKRGVSDVLGAAPSPKAGEGPTAADRLRDLALDLDPSKLELFELSQGCARYFDVEDALSEEIVEAPIKEVKPQPKRVPYPTQTMAFELAAGLHEAQDFLIIDPRMILYDLAANRQLVRAYLHEEEPEKPRRLKKTAVRVYVLDASGSMYGKRARFRDAILLAELSNLRKKVAAGQPFDPIYFSYFNDQPTDLRRIESASEAAWLSDQLLSESRAAGQTDITLALMSAFESIRAAQGRDPYLARATVVLVTDGEDRVDAEAIRRTRAPLSGVEIAFSFVSLGELNSDLRALVNEQREKGGRAFYYHLSDTELGQVRTEFDSGWRTLLPRDLEVSPASLEALAPHLEALEAMARNTAPAKAIAEAGAFDAYFPGGAMTLPPGRQANPPDVDRACDILLAVSETASLAPADDRAADAVTLLRHLLELYGISAESYLTLVAKPPRAVEDAVKRVRLLCRPYA